MLDWLPLMAFADLARRRLVWERALEDWNVETSEIVQEWIALGKTRGKEEGRAEGRAEALRSKLVRLLRNRHGEAAADLVALAEAQTNADVLDRWVDAAMDLVGLDEVRKALGSA